MCDFELAKCLAFEGLRGTSLGSGGHAIARGDPRLKVHCSISSAAPVHGRSTLSNRLYPITFSIYRSAMDMRRANPFGKIRLREPHRSVREVQYIEVLR